MKDTNASIEEKNRDITNKSAEKADAEADKTASEEAKDTAMNEQQQNKNEEAALHKSCDFVRPVERCKSPRLGVAALEN